MLLLDQEVVFCHLREAELLDRLAAQPLDLREEEQVVREAGEVAWRITNNEKNMHINQPNQKTSDPKIIKNHSSH